MIKNGQILNNEQLVNLFGNENQIKKFKETKTLQVKTKNSLLKKLASYCEYEETKIGVNKAYKIIKIHDDIKEVVDKRTKGNNSIFTEDFKTILIETLYNDKSEEKLISKSSLFRVANLINDNYKLGRNKKIKLAELLNIPKKTIDDFYDESFVKMRKTVESCLKSCRSSSIFEYEEVVAVCIYEANVHENMFNKPIVTNGKDISSNIRETYREATKEEKQFIIRCENEMKAELGFAKNTSNNTLYAHRKYDAFKQGVKDKFKNSNSNIKFAYRAYKLTWNNDLIEELYEKHCSTENLIHSKKKINENMIKSINKTNKTREKHMINGKINIIENFIEDNNKLIETLVDKKADSIEEDLKKIKNRRDKQ